MKGITRQELYKSTRNASAPKKQEDDGKQSALDTLRQQVGGGAADEKQSALAGLRQQLVGSGTTQSRSNTANQYTGQPAAGNVTRNTIPVETNTDSRLQQFNIDVANAIDQGSSQYKGEEWALQQHVRNRWAGFDNFGPEDDTPEYMKIAVDNLRKTDEGQQIIASSRLAREDRDKLLNQYSQAVSGLQSGSDWDTQSRAYLDALYETEKYGGIEKLLQEQQQDAESDREYGRQLRGVDLSNMTTWDRIKGTLGGIVKGAGEQIAAGGVGLATSSMNRGALLAEQEYDPAIRKAAINLFYSIMDDPNAEGNQDMTEQVRKAAALTGGDQYANALISRIQQKAAEARDTDYVNLEDLFTGLESDDQQWNRIQEQIADTGVYKSISNLQESAQKHIQYAKDVNLIQSKFGDNMVEAGVSAIQNTADAALAAVLGLSGGAAMIPFALRAYGGSYAEALQQSGQLGETIGKDVAKKAQKYGLETAAVEVGTEMMWGIVGSMSKVTRGGALDDYTLNKITDALSSLAKTERGAKALSWIAEKAVGGVTEGLEEVIGDYANWILNTAGIMTGDARQSLGEVFKESIHSFVTGALGGLMGEATNIVAQPLQQAQAGKMLKAGTLTTDNGQKITVDNILAMANLQGMRGTTLQQTADEILGVYGGRVRSADSLSNEELGRLFEAYQNTMGKSDAAMTRILDAMDKVESGQRLSNGDVNRITQNQDAVNYLRYNAGMELDFTGNVESRRQAVETALKALASQNTGLYDAMMQNAAENTEETQNARNAALEAIMNRQAMPGEIADQYMADAFDQSARDALKERGVSDEAQAAIASTLTPGQDLDVAAEEAANIYKQARTGNEMSDEILENEKISPMTASVAWDAARSEYTKELNNGGEEGLRLREGLQGNDSQSAGGQSQGVEQTSESVELREGTAGFERSRQVSGVYSKPVSAAELGIAGGSANRNIRILTNSTNQHVLLAQKIIEAQGLKFVAFTGGAMEINGEQVRGYYDPTTSTVYVRADHRLFNADQIARHEAMHDKIRKSGNPKELLRKMRDEMIRRLGGAENFEKVMRNYMALYERTGLDYERVFEEAVCDAAGNMNEFVYSGHWNDARAAKGFYEAGRAAGKNVTDTGTGATGEKDTAESLIMTPERLSRDLHETNGIEPATREESLKIEATDPRNVARYKKEISEALNGMMPSGNLVLIGRPSDILQKYLKSDKPLYIPQKAVKKGVLSKESGGKHALGETVMGSLPYQFADPLAITGNTSLHEQAGDNSIVVWTDWMTKKGDSVIVPIVIDINGQVGVYNGVNTVFDAFNQEYVKDLLREGNILYTKNGKSIQELLPARRQVPEVQSVNASVDNVPKSEPSVKPNLTKDHNTRFSMDRPIERTNRLIALHNMNEDAVRGMLEIGGLAMPSVAITRADMGHNTYGDISAVYGRDSISPTNRKNRIYSGDAWTPTFPDVGIKINTKAARQIQDKMKALLGEDAGELYNRLALDSDNLTDQIKRWGTFAKGYKDGDAFRLAFLRDTGRTLTVPKMVKQYTNLVDNQTLAKLAKNMDLEDAWRGYETFEKYKDVVGEARKEYFASKYGEEIAERLYSKKPISYSDYDTIVRAAINYARSGNAKVIDKSRLNKRLDNAFKTKKIQAEYESWMDNLGKDLIEKRGIRNNTDFFTPMGNRRSFEQLYYPYTLANIVRAMEGQAKQGKASVLTGSGNIKGAAQRQYSSIEEARRDIDKLQPLGIDEDKNEAIKAFNEHTLDLCQRMVEGQGHSSFGGAFDAAEVLVEVIPKYQTAEGIYRYLKREGYDGYYNVTMEIAKDIENIIKEARQLPTAYFEGKMYRAVPINEALAYVVPDNMDKNLKQQLIDAGANVVTYKHGNDEDRLAKVNSIEGARFSRDMDSEYMAAAERGDTTAAQRMVDEAAKEAGYDMHLYHGAKNGGGFNKFKDWSYFTDNKFYAEKYQQRGKPDSVYDVYVKSGRIFDTRNSKDRAIFEKYKREYGLSNLQQSGLPDWTDGYDIVDFIETNGLDYDGVILDEGQQYFPQADNYEDRFARVFSYVVRESKQVKSAAPITYDDDGNIIPLSERFNPKNDDIRYSRDLSTSDLFEANRQLRKDLSEMRQLLKTRTAQKDYWKGQTKVTEGRQLRQDDVNRLARELIKSGDSFAKAETIGTKLKDLGEYLLNTEDDFETLHDKSRMMAYEIAHDILDNSKALNTKGGEDFYQDFRYYLRNHAIYVAPSVREELAPDGWNDFRKDLFGTMTLTADKTKGQTVDKAYQDLRSQFGDWLLPEIGSEADQLNRILEVVETYRPVYENQNSYDMADAVEWTANEIMTRIIGDEIRETNPTYADRMEKKLAQQKAKTQAALKRVREQRDRKVANIKQHYQETAEKNRNRKAENAERERLLHIARRLSNMKLPRVQRALLDQYIGDLDLVSKSILGRTVRDLKALEEKYNALKKEKGEDFIADPYIEGKLERLGKKQISDLTQEEVLDLTMVLQNIETMLRTEQKLINSKVKEDTYLAGERVIDDIRNSNGKTGFLNRYISTETATPEREIHRVTGYNDEDPLYQVTKELSDGQRKMLDYQMRAEALFKKWTLDKTFIRKIAGKNAELIKIQGLVNGKMQEAKITPAMRMSLYLHEKNDENMTHIATGGVRIPDWDLYRKGKLQEAYDKGERVVLSRGMVKEIVSHMTPQEKAFADAASAYFNGMSRNEINDVSEETKGYALANVPFYFPINTDDAFLNKEFDTIKNDGSIEGMGFTKERKPSASNPVRLYDMTDVLNRSIQQHSKYVGLAIPVRNMNKLYRVMSQGYGTSVVEALKQNWGADATKYIEKMMADIQNGTAHGGDVWGSWLARARSRYAQAVLTTNASVAFKQTASYPTAAAVVGWGPLLKAFKDTKKIDLEKFAKYTPLLWYRSKGFSNMELGDIGKEGRHIPKFLNWIQGMDVATTTKLVKAAMIYVNENSDLTAYSDEWYKEVARIYNRIIEETQPNYTMMQRPQVLRSDSDLTRALFMFKTQPFQNFNILYDAFGNLAAKTRQYKANGSQENLDALKSARKNAARAVSSQIVSAFVFSLMQFAWDAFRGKTGKYDDDDGERTLLSWLKGMGLNILSSAGGMVPFGGFALELGEALTDAILKAIGNDPFFDQTFYGLSENASESFNDMGNALIKIGKNVASAFDGEKITEKSIRSLIDSGADIAQFAGVPVGNVIKLAQSVARNVYLATEGEYIGGYHALRVTTDPSTYPGDYYNLLYKAYKKDYAAYTEIYQDMISDRSGVFTEDKVKSAIETRMKADQGVNSVKDLESRWMSPAQQSSYNADLIDLQSTGIWKNATAAQQETALNQLYNLSVGSSSGLKISEKIDGGKSVGLDQTEYLLFTIALQMHDEDGNGSYKQAETEAAIRSIPGLSNAERAYLFDLQHPTAKKNPWR